MRQLMFEGDRNVSFKYPDAKDYALRNVSFKLLPGQLCVRLLWLFLGCLLMRSCPR